MAFLGESCPVGLSTCDESRIRPPVGQVFSLKSKLREIRNRKNFSQISRQKITGSWAGSGLSPACKDWGSLDDGGPVAGKEKWGLRLLTFLTVADDLHGIDEIQQ
jgi:hypothetical protein